LSDDKGASLILILPKNYDWHQLYNLHP
jgi:hypothetical protein